jgi:transposase
MKTSAHKIYDNAKKDILYIAFELSENKWKIAFGNGTKQRQRNIEAGDIRELEKEIEKAKGKLNIKEGCRIVSCYEAGRDGFWIHRSLEERGIENIIVEPASIEVNRRAKRAKTDRLDADKLLRQLIRYVSGEKGVYGVVHVPSEGEEDARRLHREREALKKERTRHINRIKSLLALHGIRCKEKGKVKWKEYIRKVRTWKGKEIPERLKEEILREIKRLELVDSQLEEIDRNMMELLHTSDDPAIKKIRMLMKLRGVGKVGAWQLVMEWFNWRGFKNRKQLAGLAGLTGTPYTSGSSKREQGICKAGNKRIRALMIQLAWGWLRHQRDSSLSKWFRERFEGSNRLKKVGIVALARKLLVELWRYLETDIVSGGTLFKSVEFKGKL